MESLELLVLCLTAALAQCDSLLSSQIRDSVGLTGNSESASRSETVFVFLNQSTGDFGDETGGLNDGDLLAVAGDLEQRDPSAIFAQYNGNDLITSHASLFTDLDNSVGDESYAAVLKKVKAHQKKGTPADLVVLQSYPEGLLAEISKLCDTTEKCKVVTTFLNGESNHARFRRADADTSTVAPPSLLTPQERANIPLDSVAAFHLLFWTSLAIALTVWGTAYGMWHMDPGRDSIIYRMTSAQKFKKDK